VCGVSVTTENFDSSLLKMEKNAFTKNHKNSLLFFLFGGLGLLFERFSLSLTLSLSSLSFLHTHNNMPIIMSSKRVVRRLRRRLRLCRP
tara:strand:+ start:79 stop:345 length:267 start_codon:yes stop_codon:yes gene_type:complete